mgnify:CR=1 FL=1
MNFACFGEGFLDSNAPGNAIGVRAPATNFAADFDEVVFDAFGFEYAGNFVYAVAFCDCGEIAIDLGSVFLNG